MNNTYTLVAVTDLQGKSKQNAATQNNLLGKKCKMLFIDFGKRGTLQFEKLENPYLNISAVQKIEVNKNNTGIAITTLNSIYNLERED